MGLILHSGGKVATLQEVAAVVTPEGTGTYWPTSHIKLVEGIKERLGDQGMNVTAEKYGLARDGARMFGVLDTGHSIIEGVTLQVGVRNSHDRSMSRGCVMGEHVLNCDNTSFTGELEAIAKHSRYGDRNFGLRIERMLEKLAPMAAERAEEIMAWQSRAVNGKDVNDLIVRAYRKGALRATDIDATLEAFEGEMPEANDKTIWRFYNAVTRVGKCWGAESHARRTMRLTKVVRRYMQEV